MDRDSRLTIEYLRTQPANGVVRWASDHLTEEAPWTAGWIDVRIPEGGPLGMSWVWTIVTPDDPDQLDPDELWCFACPYDREGGWSAAAVSDALAAWAARHAGRGDLRFAWDPKAGPSPTLRRIVERAEACGQVWELGDGLTLHDGALDDLLALHPDEAAELTARLREAAAAVSSKLSDR
jgi:hypothetical protein